MTNLEAISADLYPFDVPESWIEKKCIEEGVDVQANYSADDKLPVAKATIAILRNLIVLKSESNGGISQSYGTDELKERIFGLAKENGLDDIADEFDSRSTITDVSKQW